jgi:hypothetical protein
MGIRPIVRLRTNKRTFLSANSTESYGGQARRKDELGLVQNKHWPDGNAASVEIHKKRGFPQLLGVSPRSGETFPHSHRPYHDSTHLSTEHQKYSTLKQTYDS